MKLSINRHYFILLAIVLFASFLYLLKLDHIPNGLYADEATVGYNAYSILETSHDEYGKLLPIAFRFFGAYTPPLYVYLVVPFIKLFGLNIVSIRLLSALTSLLGIFVVYFFVQKLNIYQSTYTKYLAALIFSICPWVVFNARLGYEVTLGYILFSLGALFVWNSLNKSKISLLGVTLLSLSTYVAHTERYLAPIFILVIILVFRKHLFQLKNKSNLIISFLILLVTQIPNFYLMFTPAFWVKNMAISNPSFSLQLYDFIHQFLTYISPAAIFGESPDINLQHTLPHLSLFYSWLIIPFFVGLYQLYLKSKSAGGKFLIIMFLTAPIPGALSGHFISVQRVLTLIIPMILIMALGFEFLFQKFKPALVILVISILSIFSLILLWRSYFVFLPTKRAVWWNYGYSQLTEIIKSNPQNKYLIDNTRNGAGYINFLFYLKYPPIDFQKQFSPEFVRNYYQNPPYNPNYSFANLELRPIYWQKDIYINQIMVGDALAFSDSQVKEHFLAKVFEIKDPIGQTVFVGYQTNPTQKLLHTKK